MTILRMCHPHDYTEFLTYDTESDSFHGAASDILYEALDLLTRGMKNQLTNLTLAFQPSKMFDHSSVTSESNEACIAALQSNRSDILLTFVPYPKNIANISEGLIVYETILMMGSAYKKSTQVETSQVLASFKSFSLSLWALCLFTFFSMLVVLKLHNWIKARGAHNNDLSLLACHFSRLNEISSVGLARKLIFLCASLYSLVVVHYFCTLIKTELVTIRDPLIFSSYQDIIDRGAGPAFLRAMSHDTPFKSKDAEPHKKELWKYAVNKFGEENLYVDINPITFALIGFAVLLMQEVVIIDSLLMPIMPGSGCMAAARDPEKFLEVFKMVRGGGLMSYMQSSGFEESHIEYLRRYIKRYPDIEFDSHPTFNLLMSVDPREKSYLLGIAMSKHISMKVREAIQRTVRRAIEGGFNLKFATGLVGYNILDRHPLISNVLGKKVKSMHHLQQECETCAIVRPDLEYHALTLGNFRTLFILVAAVLPIIFFIHILSQHTAKLERSLEKRNKRFRTR